MSHSKNPISQLRILIIPLVFYFVFFATATRAASVELKAVADTMLTNDPTSTLSRGALEVGCTGTTFDSAIYQSLIRFDLSSLPRNATINAAKLRVYFGDINADNVVPISVGAKRITSSWGEEETSYQHRPDYDSNTITSTSISRSHINTYIPWDLTDVVKKWYVGAYPNYGVMLYNRNICAENDIIWLFFSSREDTENHSPLLYIDYTPDTTRPVISNIHTDNIGETSAEVHWSTDENSTSGALYGKRGQSFSGIVGNQTDFVTTHKLTLSNLEPGTEYEFRVSSKDAAGNLMITTTNSSFETESHIVEAPPDEAVFAEPANNENQTEPAVPAAVNLIEPPLPSAPILPESEPDSIILDVPATNVADVPAVDADIPKETSKTDLDFSTWPLIIRILFGFFAFSSLALLIAVILWIDRKRNNPNKTAGSFQKPIN